MQWLYQNGNLVSATEAGISVLDSAVLHGRALIETFAARNGRVFRLAEHYDRLSTGCSALSIPSPISLDDLRKAVGDVLERNETEEARLRLTVTAGVPGVAPSVTLTAAPLTDYTPGLYKRGMRATISDVRRNETSPLSRIKSAAGLLDGLLARERAHNARYDDAILLNTKDSVACGAIANLFIGYHGRIMTPPIDSGALPGITRAAVLALAREEGIPAIEADFSAKELTGADEAFFTNAIMGIMPITEVHGTRLGSGPMTARLGEALHRAASGE